MSAAASTLAPPLRFFITGTAGFIGYHLAMRLLADGHHVVGYDGMTPYYDVTLKQARVARLSASPAYHHIVGMLEDLAALRAAAERAQPDVIVHLAAQAGVRYSIENPAAYASTNLIGSFHVLEIARELQPKHLLLASTSSVYGGNEKIPFAESDPADEPMTLYAATKKSMEVMAHSYAHLWQTPTTAFRFFTVYGPYGRPDMALFKFVAAMLKDQPIEIYGEGKMARDFTYIDDLIEAIVRLVPVIPSAASRVTAPGVVDSLSPVAPYRIVNLGGGQPIGLMAFIDIIEAELGITACKLLLPMQKGDVPRTFAAPDLLRALTDYVPGTSVETGVKAFITWYRDFYRINSV